MVIWHSKFWPQARLSRNGRHFVDLEMVLWHSEFWPQVRIDKRQKPLPLRNRDFSKLLFDPNMIHQVKWEIFCRVVNGTLTFRILTPGKIIKHQKPLPLRNRDFSNLLFDPNVIHQTKGEIFCRSINGTLTLRILTPGKIEMHQKPYSLRNPSYFLTPIWFTRWNGSFLAELLIVLWHSKFDPRLEFPSARNPLSEIASLSSLFLGLEP